MSNESSLAKGALLPTLVIGSVGIAASTLIQGKPGFFGSVLALGVVAIFFIIHIGISKLSRDLDPISTMALALFSYFAKLLFLGVGLYLVARFTDRATVDRTSFGISAIALTAAWLTGEIRAYLRLKLHLPLPPK